MQAKNTARRPSANTASSALFIPSPNCWLRPNGTNQQHDTQIFETVTVHYCWHPLSGQKLRVTAHAKITNSNEVICQRSDGTRVVLPLWMLDPKCSEFVVGQPVISLDALIELRQLLAARVIARQGWHQ